MTDTITAALDAATTDTITAIRAPIESALGPALTATLWQLIEPELAKAIAEVIAEIPKALGLAGDIHLALADGARVTFTVLPAKD